MSFIQTEKLPGRQRNRAVKDYSAQRFGRLVAIELVERSPSRDHKWRFACDCGGALVTSIRSVRSGHTSSCGCVHKEGLVKRNSTHGLSRSFPREYRSWKDMRARCTRKSSKDYAGYGGRGIRVCARWDDFAAFLEDMGECPHGCTIDRIDVNGGYSPENCRWAPAKIQANNKRSNARLTIDGETRTLQQWCDHYGVEHSKVRWRLAQGWALEKVFSGEDFRRPSR